MEARFEDILHLVAYNGYAEDTRQAVAVNRLTWTDDRLWYPGLLPQRFGSKQKGRLQILAEHKNPYGSDEGLMARYNTLEQMAKDTHHIDIFRAQIDVRDTDGNSALTAAIEKRCPNAVEFLVSHGADINQTNKKGRSALNLAKGMDQSKDKEVQSVKKPNNGRRVIATVLVKRSEKIVEYLTKLGAVDIPEEPERYGLVMMRHRMQIWQHQYIGYVANRINQANNMPFNPVLNSSIALRTHDANPPKPKRLKASLYKRQFGR